MLGETDLTEVAQQATVVSSRNQTPSQVVANQNLANRFQYTVYSNGKVVINLLLFYRQSDVGLDSGLYTSQA